MAMVGQNSSKRSCDGRYYLFYRWLNPIPVSVFVQGKPTWCRRLFPVRPPPVHTRSSWSPRRRSPGVGRQPQITSLANVQNSQTTPHSSKVSPLYFAVGIALPFIRAKVSRTYVGRPFFRATRRFWTKRWWR